MTYLELLDWRRRVAELYARVRALREKDPQAAHTEWRATRDRLFAEHPESPLEAGARAGFTTLPCFPYDPGWSWEVAVSTDVEPERFTIMTSTGTPMDFIRFGRVELPVGSLDVFWLDAYSGGVFLPFRDATAGRETYGGGRYLLDTVKGADLGTCTDGRLVLDFNFAYHPSCYHSPQWSCPLAPPGNRLAVRLTAGERAADPR